MFTGVSPGKVMQYNLTENRCITRLTLWVAVRDCSEAMLNSSCPQVQQKSAQVMGNVKQRGTALRTHRNVTLPQLSTESCPQPIPGHLHCNTLREKLR